MATVTFTHTDSITLDTPADWQWVAPVTGNAGDATFTLPYSSPAASDRYVNMLGGSLVAIADLYGCGEWRGVVNRPERTAEGLRIAARQVSAILGRRHIQTPRMLANTSPSAVVYAALRDSGEVLGLHAVNGPWDGTTPIVESYTLSGQDVWSVVNWAMDVSAGEPRIDGVTGEVRWCGPLACARAYPHELIADANLFDWALAVDTSDQAAEVTAMVGDEPITARDARVAIERRWPAQLVTSAPNRPAARAVADDLLSAHAQPAIIITGSVPTRHWDIRERDIVRVSIPRRRDIAAEAFTCRVMGRAVSDASPLMRLSLLIVDAIPTRPRLRPVRPTQARGRGYGTVQQRLIQLARERAV